MGRSVSHGCAGTIAPELVDEKLKIEVATMQFLSEKTTIPVPLLSASGLTGNLHYRDGLPFLVLTHVAGKPLPTIWKELENPAKRKMYEQLTDVVMQLHLQPFDRIDALTLDDRDR
jgi:Phosphotransferase enzyme family